MPLACSAQPEGLTGFQHPEKEESFPLHAQLNFAPALAGFPQDWSPLSRWPFPPASHTLPDGLAQLHPRVEGERGLAWGLPVGRAGRRPDRLVSPMTRRRRPTSARYTPAFHRSSWGDGGTAFWLQGG